MKKNFFPLALVLSMTFFCIGCFDITEELTLAKDGSGKYEQTMDASGMVETLSTLGASDTTGQMTKGLKHTLDSTFNAQFELYKDTKGISNVKIDTTQDFIYKFSANFVNLKAINDMLSKADNNKAQVEVYAFEKGVFTRSNRAMDLDNDMFNGENAESMRVFMDQMHYKTIVHLPSNVGKMSNKNAVIAADKKTVTISCTFSDLLDKKTELANVVKF